LGIVFKSSSVFGVVPFLMLPVSGVDIKLFSYIEVMPICIENISLSVDKALAVFGHVSVEGGLATLLSVGLEYKCCSVFHLDCASPRGGLANFKISSQAKGLKGWGNCVKLDALACFLQCRGIGI